MSRILSLSDGIFAFAMTLLVLNLTGLPFLQSSSPSTGTALVGSLSGTASAVIGYATVFFVISLWWVGHHRIFRYIERYDLELIWLNIFLLLTIAVTPFALEIYNKFYGTPAAVILLTSVEAVTGFLMAAIWFHASWNRKLVDPRLPEAMIYYYRRRNLIFPVIFLAVIPLAIVAPAYATYAFFAVFPASLFTRRYAS